MPELNDRVRVDARGDPYHGMTGTVTQILNGQRTPLENIPEGSPDRYPYWFLVTFDASETELTPPPATFLNYELRVVPPATGGTRGKD